MDRSQPEAAKAVYFIQAGSSTTGVQVFDGQPSSMNIDGTTAGVPNCDMLRVERAYFTWNHVGGSPLYLSIGRRPSTDGPPLNFREDEPRGGTPSGALIDFQFDGITVGYHFNDKMVWRLCYGVGYQSGFGNGNILKSPADRLKDTHLIGANLDLYSTDKTFIQATYAHAFNVTDGFNGLLVLPVNPVTGDPVNAPVVMRYTPSANLGAINLFGVNLNRRVGDVDLYLSGNYSGTRPNGVTTPFGGLMSDPFEDSSRSQRRHVLRGSPLQLPAERRTHQDWVRVQPWHEVLVQLRPGGRRHHRSEDQHSRRCLRNLPHSSHLRALHHEAGLHPLQLQLLGFGMARWGAQGPRHHCHSRLPDLQGRSNADARADHAILTQRLRAGGCESSASTRSRQSRRSRRCCT